MARAAMITMITQTIINSTMENPASRFFIGDPHSLSRRTTCNFFLSNDTFLKKQLYSPLKTLHGPGGFGKFNRSTHAAKGDVGTRRFPPNAKGRRPTGWPLSCSYWRFLLQ